MWTKAAVVLLCGVLAAQGAGGVDDGPEAKVAVRPDVYSLRVVSEVHHRFARTVVTSRVANRADEAQEISFDAVLPETAFVSGFVIEMDGESYRAYVRGKEEASKEYSAAVESGRGAAHIATSARDSNVVSVSVNVEAHKKVTFNLTYEELLVRKLGAYNLRINLDPGQLVEDLSVEVHINESSPIAVLKVPNLQESNEVDQQPDKASNPLAQVGRPTPKTATVRWAPSREQQRQLREEGVKGQLVVSYDVDHAAHPDQILVSDDGYFVHLYSPPDLQPLPKHVVFVLDTSGSMAGRKIDQLKAAMHAILAELQPTDTFSIVPFASSVQVWQPEEPLQQVDDWSDTRRQRLLEPVFNESAVVNATEDNVQRALRSIDRFIASGATFLFRAVSTGLRLCAAGRQSGRASLLLLLTDGEPNGDVSNPDEIVNRVSRDNAEGRASVFALAFGSGADYSFLRRLALRNYGFARRIYEAADAHLQLADFYRQIASPLLADVNFTYADGQVEAQSLTRSTFPTLFRGSELLVAGKLAPGEDAAATPTLGAAVVATGADAAPVPGTPSQQRVTSAERLWAFLTVSQLLDQHAANPNDTVRDAARQLALKYSFVTPVTSLVVVKPNETTRVELEDAQPGWSRGPAGGIMFRSYSAPMLPASGAIYPSPRVGVAAHRHTALVLPAPRVSGVHHIGLSGPPGLPAAGPGSPVSSMDAIDGFATTGAGPRESLVAQSDVTWLDSVCNGSSVNLNVNGTLHHLSLASSNTSGAINQVLEQYPECSTSQQEAGRCLHFTSCPLERFATSLDTYLAGYFCTVDTSFLGVCCPDYLAAVALTA